MKPILPLIAFMLLWQPCSILAQSSNNAPTSTESRDYTFNVSANRLWTDTALDLHSGDRVHITGAVMACEGPVPGEKLHLILPTAPAGALIAKLNLEEPPVNASPDLDAPIVAPSHLYLGVNGWHCHGQIPVKVQVECSKPCKTPPQK